MAGTIEVISRGHEFAFDTDTPLFPPSITEEGEIDPGTLLLVDEMVESWDGILATLDAQTKQAPADWERMRWVEYCGGHGLSGLLLSPLVEEMVAVSDDYLVSSYVGRQARRNGLDNHECRLGPAFRWNMEAESAGGVMANLLFVKGKDRFRPFLRWSRWVLEPGGTLCVTGHRTHSIEPFADLMKEVFGDYMKVRSKGGYRLLAARKSVPLGEEEKGSPLTIDERRLRYRGLELLSRPGVFASGRIDDGTDLLVRRMRISAGDSVLDLGCGLGVLGIMAKMAGAETVAMVDTNATAADLAERNAALNEVKGVEVKIGDGYAPFADRRFDVILSNPPLHQEHLGDKDTIGEFIAGAPKRLKAGGSLQVVASRHVPCERHFEETFGRENWEIDVQNRTHKVVVGRKKGEKR